MTCRRAADLRSGELRRAIFSASRCLFTWGVTKRRALRIAVMRARSEQLLAVIVCYLESTDRGDSPEIVSLLATGPDTAAELQDFVNTYVRLPCPTAPVRDVAQALRTGAAACRPARPGRAPARSGG
jgi:hypothetical protein